MADKNGLSVIPAEWAPHQAIWTAWPSHEDLWQDDLPGARAEVTAMIKVLAGGDRIKVLACGDEAITSATQAVGDCATVIAASFGDIWLRDTGPIFSYRNKQLVALRFNTNGWGGKYQLAGDNTVGDDVAKAAGTTIHRHDFVLEGGALEHNGAGSILTTRQCLLNPNRNTGWTQASAERILGDAFNVSQVLWLDDGLLNDHTDGHIDNLARFIAADEVVCQTASGANDPNAKLYDEIASRLTSFGLTVHRIPSPGLVTNDDGEIMPASHMNFIVGNSSVVVPTYNAQYGDTAVRALQALFPDRHVIGVGSNHLLTGGGSFHCITQQEPAI